MAKRKTVGIKDLKNNLSAYLREVRQGTRVFVSDRGEVVAELHEPGAVYATEDESNPVLAAWVREGVVTLPKRPMTPVPKSPVRLPNGTAARLLDEDRRDRDE
jgi:antitoxin (DNA-binding transcriptional repressor) of toxin-antitoxin stability system